MLPMAKRREDNAYSTNTKQMGIQWSGILQYHFRVVSSVGPCTEEIFVSKISKQIC